MLRVALMRVMERVPGDPRLGGATPAEVSRAVLEGRPWDGVGPMVLAVGLVLLGAGVMGGLWAYRHRHTVAPPPLLTYHRLAKGVGLSLEQQLALWWVGRRRRLPSPITLMVCPVTFDLHAGAYLVVDLKAGEGWLTRRLVEVRGRLFASSSGGKPLMSGDLLA